MPLVIKWKDSAYTSVDLNLLHYTGYIWSVCNAEKRFYHVGLSSLSKAMLFPFIMAKTGQNTRCTTNIIDFAVCFHYTP